MDLQALPKTELHLHLEGATPLPTLLALIHKYSGSAEVPSVAELQRRLVYPDFAGFLSAWQWMAGHLREYEDFSWIARGVASDLASHGVRYAEIFFSPPDFRHHGLELQRLARAVRAGIDAARVPIQIQLIVDLCRQYGPELGARWLEETAEVAAEAGIVGVGLGGPEHLAPPAPYMAVYRRAAELGLRRVAHAGEAASADSVWGAIRDLGVERIGHGTRSIEDPELVAYLREQAIPVEVCITSNLRTGVVPRLEDHPICQLFDAGVHITLSSDDPTFFGSDIVGEYTLLRDRFGFSNNQIVQIARNGFEAAFLPREDKTALLCDFDAWTSAHDLTGT